MVKEVKKKDWVERDEDIRMQKKKTWETLMRWVKTRREDDREELSRKRKRLRKIRKYKRIEEIVEENETRK